MFKVMAKFRSLLITTFIATITTFLVWYLLYIFASAKEPVTHPSPTAKVISLYKGTTVTPKGKDIRWISLKGNSKGWLHKGSGLPLQPKAFQAKHVLVLAEGSGAYLGKKLHEFLKKNKLISKVTVMSSADGMIKDLRYNDNEIALSYGQAFLIRLQALAPLKLKELLVFDKDVAFINPQSFKYSLLELSNIFQDKKIPVIIGPINEGDTVEYPKNAILLKYKDLDKIGDSF